MASKVSGLVNNYIILKTIPPDVSRKYCYIRTEASNLFFPTAIVVQGRPKFQTFMKYAAVELTPPSPGDIPAIRAGIGKIINGAKTGAWKNVTVKEATLNTLVTLEVFFWFYIGECIGKRHLVGYDV
ncbi:ATP synthase subunit g, mitochondrial [Pseudolycoriella hygida]|uniref:ATP synthase subunit g, mitochondrial n=1 Tax=Pseudolycoriella hygida TaxID=35572 RepID=A0A9Q0NHP6_9DIPT|nr:ATP synthase subunit g, mitochondrial [Pseudolycoriella hygida]